jgi:hypothetical protein
MITNSMEPHEESELVSLVEDYANAIRAWDKQQLLGRFVVQSRQDIVNYAGSLLAAKDAEIAALRREIRALSNVGELFDGMDECNEDTHEENYKVLEAAMDRIYELVSNPKQDA